MLQYASCVKDWGILSLPPFSKPKTERPKWFLEPHCRFLKTGTKVVFDAVTIFLKSIISKSVMVVPSFKP